ncbi:sortase family protein [Xylanimonas cellulosilytica DSM 15894]|uniref:Sortase family protein n=1 Tax=Xylanimonas cellulosilytica (strain DSM 15894 / JCM 12276 / CECT 5975 / KCTC 9989 / LMG 20990 / NBRC 107835 / XIL07) TaxID=446471 RepID=D1BS60_XYLCX|nr:class C sortase [Xylanimonas cellulosilytica]ACZ30552.1 sortase family protein [Xylanimonas cellulosilytica DSM 15894]
MTAVVDAPPPSSAPTPRRRRPNAYLIISLVFLVACVGLVAWVLGERAYSDRLMANRAQAAVQAVQEEWTQEERDAMLAAAHEYNVALLTGGSPTLGEATDPFSGEVLSEADETYQSVMRLTDSGIMGRLQVPQIGVDLPILHGTSESALRQGAGHLYGTSVPVGGDGTLSVLSAHSGQVTATGFLRLSELKHGDYIYIQSIGDTLGYVVDDIDVIASDDFSHFVIEPAQDRIILMTCTPIGINTERLLVTATRADIPDVVPAVEDAPVGDAIPLLFQRALWVVGALVLLAVVRIVRRRRRRQRQPFVP